MLRHLHLIAACCLPASFAMASLAVPQPLFLLNTSPSQPRGLYLRAPGPPERGRIAAFHVPPPGRVYAEAYLPEVGRNGVLKPLIGSGGDRVCIDRALSLNGRILGPVRDKDSHGRPLSHWRGCRTLKAGEFLAYSDRIPNSFDSRYFGPVAAADIIGVYEPLWVRP